MRWRVEGTEGEEGGGETTAAMICPVARSTRSACSAETMKEECEPSGEWRTCWRDPLPCLLPCFAALMAARPLSGGGGVLMGKGGGVKVHTSWEAVEEVR